VAYEARPSFTYLAAEQQGVIAESSSYAKAGETSPLRELETSFCNRAWRTFSDMGLITISRSLVVNSALMTDGFSKHGSRPTICWESRLGRALRFVDLVTRPLHCRAVFQAIAGLAACRT
jgi:hypothetical protein